MDIWICGTGIGLTAVHFLIIFVVSTILVVCMIIVAICFYKKKVICANFGSKVNLSDSTNSDINMINKNRNSGSSLEGTVCMTHSEDTPREDLAEVERERLLESESGSERRTVVNEQEIPVHQVHGVMPENSEHGMASPPPYERSISGENHGNPIDPKLQVPPDHSPNPPEVADNIHIEKNYGGVHYYQINAPATFNNYAQGYGPPNNPGAGAASHGPSSHHAHPSNIPRESYDSSTSGPSNIAQPPPGPGTSYYPSPTSDQQQRSMLYRGSTRVPSESPASPVHTRTMEQVRECETCVCPTPSNSSICTNQSVHPDRRIARENSSRETSDLSSSATSFSVCLPPRHY